MPILDPGRQATKEMIEEASSGEVFEATPTESSIVQLPATARNLTVLLKGSTDLNAFTLKVPPESASVIGQRLFIRIEFAVENLTVSGETGDTVDGWMLNLQPNDNAIFYKFKARTWSRLA